MADSVRSKALQNISNALPVANAQVAAGQNAARQMQIQSAVRGAPAGAGTATAQTTGAAVAENAGQQAIQSAGQAVQQQGQVGQLGIAEQARQNQGEVQSLASGAKENEIANVERLAAIDSRAKDELYDKQMNFAQDENGRTLFNEQQLADYARISARSDQEYQNYAQAAKQASDRKLQMMETAFHKIEADLNYKYAQAKQAGDQAAQQQIAQQQAENAARMEREKARASNSAAAWNAGGQIVGAVAGGVLGSVVPGIGTAVGATAGAGLGGALGSLAGGT